MNQRRVELERRTAETGIELILDLDGDGTVEVDTGIGFLDHLFTTLCRHARYDLRLTCRGDLQVDDHHTAEDCALLLGSADTPTPHSMRPWPGRLSISQAVPARSWTWDSGVIVSVIWPVRTSAISSPPWQRRPGPRSTSMSCAAGTTTTGRRLPSRPWRWRSDQRSPSTDPIGSRAPRRCSDDRPDGGHCGPDRDRQPRFDRAFAAAIRELEEYDLTTVLRERIEARRQTLAICLGMQLLGEGSEESPGTAGLGIIPAVASRFSDAVKVPQLGWNQIEPEDGCRYLRPGFAYFANSYRIGEAPGGWLSAGTDYDGKFVSALERGPVVACQFHPELSGSWGLDLLRRWLTGQDSATGGAARC